MLSQRNASNAFRKCDNNINQHEQKKESKNGGKDEHNWKSPEDQPNQKEKCILTGA